MCRVIALHEVDSALIPVAHMVPQAPQGIIPEAPFSNFLSVRPSGILKQA